MVKPMLGPDNQEDNALDRLRSCLACRLNRHDIANGRKSAVFGNQFGTY